MREPQWEHFAHEADIGIRGFGASKAEAFERAALALTAIPAAHSGPSIGVTECQQTWTSKYRKSLRFTMPASPPLLVGIRETLSSVSLRVTRLRSSGWHRFLKRMVISAKGYGIELPDRELACAPINSDLGRSYLGAMRAAINCAFANREVITHLVREAFATVLPQAALKLIYDVSHNTCKVEEHAVDGEKKQLFVHRKGATRAFGPGHPDLPEALKTVGQPVLIGGTMGTASYILVGTSVGEARSFSSSCHGAGRRMSRHQATKQWKGRELIDYLATKGILIRSPSYRGVAEEAPGVYKDVTAVVDAAHEAGLSRKVAKLEPMICVKG